MEAGNEISDRYPGTRGWIKRNALCKESGPCGVIFRIMTAGQATPRLKSSAGAGSSLPLATPEQNNRWEAGAFFGAGPKHLPSAAPIWRKLGLMAPFPALAGEGALGVPGFDFRHKSLKNAEAVPAGFGSRALGLPASRLTDCCGCSAGGSASSAPFSPGAEAGH